MMRAFACTPSSIARRVEAGRQSMARRRSSTGAVRVWARFGIGFGGAARGRAAYLGWSGAKGSTGARPEAKARAALKGNLRDEAWRAHRLLGARSELGRSAEDRPGGRAPGL